MERKVCWVADCVFNRRDPTSRYCGKKGKMFTPKHGTRLCYAYKPRRWRKIRKKKGR